MNYTFFIKVYSFSFRNNHLYISIAFLKFHGVCVCKRAHVEARAGFWVFNSINFCLIALRKSFSLNQKLALLARLFLIQTMEFQEGVAMPGF